MYLETLLASFVMNTDLHRQAIEQVLREIPVLERNIGGESCPTAQKQLQRSLNQQQKRFEHMISYQFRMSLRKMCREVGVRGDFM